MRTFGAAFLLLFLPTLLMAQVHFNSEPFILTSPGVTTRLERFAPLSIAENPQLGGIPIIRLTVDRRGFLWVGTHYGLARFDGHELKIYRVDAADTSRTFKVQLHAIAVDGDGFVWGGTLNAGLVRLDPVTGRTRWYRGRESDSASIGDGAYRLFVSSDGALWAGTRFGLAMYNRESDSFVRYNLPPDCPRLHDGTSSTPYTITSICELGRSIFVGLNGGGLGELNRDTGIWKRYTHQPGSATGPSFDVIRAVCPDRQGRLWLATRNAGLDCYDPLSGAWRHFSVSPKGILPYKNESIPEPCTPIWSMAQDSLGGLWLTSTYAGIFRLDQATGKYILYRHDSTDATSLPDNIQNWLCAQPIKQEDGSGRIQSGSTIIWIPCGAEGMYRIVVGRDPSVAVVVQKKVGTQGFMTQELLQESPGKIWAATVGRTLGFFDLQARTVQWHPDQLSEWFRISGIRQVIRLRDRTFLLSSGPFKMWLFDPEHDTFNPLLSGLQVACFLEESDSLLWLGCRSIKGMSFIAGAGPANRQIHLSIPGRIPTRPVIETRAVSYDVHADGRGGLWYGTAGRRPHPVRPVNRRRTGDMPAQPASDNSTQSPTAVYRSGARCGRQALGRRPRRLESPRWTATRGTFDHMHRSAMQGQ